MELGQRLAAREKRTLELEARAEEAARAAEGHRSELAGTLAAARAREGEARLKTEAAEKRMAQVLRPIFNDVLFSEGRHVLVKGT